MKYSESCLLGSFNKTLNYFKQMRFYASYNEERNNSSQNK